MKIMELGHPERVFIPGELVSAETSANRHHHQNHSTAGQVPKIAARRHCIKENRKS
jgi:hypothetical protein